MVCIHDISQIHVHTRGILNPYKTIPAIAVDMPCIIFVRLLSRKTVNKYLYLYLHVSVQPT